MEKCCVVDVCDVNVLNIWDVNWVPLSLNRFLGGPNKFSQFWYALTTVTVRWSLIGTSIQNLENLSIIDNIYLLPFAVSGSGPQMSMLTSSKGRVRELVLMLPDRAAGFRPLVIR